MAIKLLEPLEPGGDFKLVKANDIAFQAKGQVVDDPNNAKTVEQLLQKLKQDIYAVPQLSYLSGTAQSNFTETKHTASKQLQFNATTRLPTSLTILVERAAGLLSDTELGSAVWQTQSAITKPSGLISLAVQAKSAFDVATYRISVTQDGKSALVNENSRLNVRKDDTKYLYFKAIYGTVTLSFVGETLATDVVTTGSLLPVKLSLGTSDNLRNKYKLYTRFLDANKQPIAQTNQDGDEIAGISVKEHGKYYETAYNINGNVMQTQVTLPDAEALGGWTFQVFADIQAPEQLASAGVSTYSTPFISQELPVLGEKMVFFSALSLPNNTKAIQAGSPLATKIRCLTSDSRAKGANQLRVQGSIYGAVEINGETEYILLQQSQAIKATHKQQFQLIIGFLPATVAFAVGQTVITIEGNPIELMEAVTWQPTNDMRGERAFKLKIDAWAYGMQDIEPYELIPTSIYTAKYRVDPAQLQSQDIEFVADSKYISKSGTNYTWKDTQSDAKTLNISQCYQDPIQAIDGLGCVATRAASYISMPANTSWKAQGDQDVKNGFTFQCYIKSNSNGLPKDQTILCLQSKGLSLHIRPQLITATAFYTTSNNGKETTYSVSLETKGPAQGWAKEGAFNHIVVVAQPIATIEDNGVIQAAPTDDLPYSTLKLYVNGCLISVAKLTQDVSSVFKFGEINALNIAKNGGERAINTQINLIRFYHRALDRETVQSRFVALTDYAQPRIAKIFFIKNNDIVGQYDNAGKSQWNSTFASLQTIQTKKGSKQAPGSKNAFVNCIAYCLIPKDTEEESDILPGYELVSQDNVADAPWLSDVDVWLQGTSSLKYPVKNYKIKTYTTDEDGKRTKLKIRPPMAKQSDTDWLTSDSTFTLKCDFMQQSHKNNAPTAMYYQDVVLPAVINRKASNANTAQYYSPARRITNGDDKPVYRDAISGLPCIVYYTDNDGENNLASFGNFKEVLKDASFPGFVRAGSFMFNVDKEGKQLGFQIKVAKAIENNVITQVTPGTLLYGQDISNLKALFGTTDIKLYTYNIPNAAIKRLLVVKGETCFIGDLFQARTVSTETDTNLYLVSIGRKALEGQTTTFAPTDTAAFSGIYNAMLANPAYWSKTLPCTSFQGGTNNNQSAAAFVPRNKLSTQDLYKVYFTTFYNDYLQLFKFYYNAFANTNEGTLPPYATNVDSGYKFQLATASQGFYALHTAQNVYKNLIAENQTFPGEALYNTLLTAPLDEYQKNACIPGVQVYTVDAQGKLAEKCFQMPQLISYTAFSGNIEEYLPQKDYINATLEPRFYYKDEIDALKKETVEPAYIRMEDTIDWVYNAAQAFNGGKDVEAGDKKYTPSTFKDDFSKYFSYEYCLTYYLQMLMFCQVDNAGKNAMFDTWGDGRLYPRPYDMDTQMGLDNTGKDVIPISAELHWLLSPQENTLASGLSATGCINYGELSSENHARFKKYNTWQTFLWKTFGQVFKQDIQDTYIALRTDTIDASGTNIKAVYSAQRVLEYIQPLTSQAISISQYNRDAISKYFAYKVKNKYSADYLYAIQGNRTSRYSYFFNRRLTFLDSVYNNTRTYTSMLLRCNAVNQSTIIGIQVLSPQYITFSVDAGNQATLCAYVDPDATYVGADGNTYKGVAFNLPTTGADKNIVIGGAGGIQAIHQLSALYPTHIELTGTNALTELNLNNATALASIVFGANPKLHTVSLRNLSAFTGTVDVQSCTALESLDLNGTKCTALVLPENAPLRHLDISNTKLSALNLVKLPQLTIDYNTRGGTTTYEGFYYSGVPLTILAIDTVPKCKAINFSILKGLEQLKITSCPKVETIVLQNWANLSSLVLQDLGQLSKVDLQGSVGNCFKFLDLSSGLPKLTEIYLQETCTSDSTAGILLFNNTSDTHAKLHSLNLRKSAIGSINPSNITNDEGKAQACTDAVMDFAKVVFEDRGGGYQSLYLGSASIPNAFVKKINNLTYPRISTYGFFTQLSQLQEVNNLCLGQATNTFQRLFQSCSNLKSLTFAKNQQQLPNVTVADSCFYGCQKLEIDDIKAALTKIPNVISLGFFCYNNDVITKIPSDLFSKNKSIIYLGGAFFSSNITTVEPGLLQPCKDTLQNVRQMFRGCYSLQRVPANLFANCTKLNTVKGLFWEAAKLCYFETAPSDGDQILGYKTLDGMFFVEKAGDVDGDRELSDAYKNITDLGALFYGCPHLLAGTSDVDAEGKQNIHAGIISSFLSQFTNLKYADSLFQGCKKIKSIPATLFADDASATITEISGMFAQCTGIEKLPENFSLTSTTAQKLTHARGLFYNCTALEGSITDSFFSKTPALQYIGAGNCHCRIAGNSPYTNNSNPAFGGMFMNTKISGYSKDFLKPLISLIDCSYFFAQGTLKGQSISLASAQQQVKSLVCTDYADQTYKNSIPAMLFSSAADLLDISGFFGGGYSNITGIYYENETEVLLPKSLIKASGLFYGNTAFTNFNLMREFAGLVDLVDVHGMFAHTNLTANFGTGEKDVGQFLVSCRNLQNISAMFLNNRLLTGILPAALFNACRTTVRDTSYMFSNTGIAGIGSGKIAINKKQDATNAYKAYLATHFTNTLAKAASTQNYKKFLLALISTSYTSFQNTYFELLAECLSWKSTVSESEGDGGAVTSWSVTCLLQNDVKDKLKKVFAAQPSSRTINSLVNNMWALLSDVLTNQYDQLVAGITPGENTALRAKAKTLFTADNLDAQLVAIQNSYISTAIQAGLNADYKYKPVLTPQKPLKDWTGNNIENADDFAQKLFISMTDDSDCLTQATSAFSQLEALKQDDDKITLAGTFGLMTAQQYQKTKPVYGNLSNTKPHQPGLLGGCTSLTSAKGMFSHCTSFNKLPPADLFTAIDVSTQKYTELKKLTDISQLFKNCHRMGVRNDGSQQPIKVANTTQWADTQLEPEGQRVVLSYGHTSHIYPISYQNICSSTASEEVKVNLISLPKSTEGMYGGYLVPQDWLKCCPNLTTVAELFCTCGFPIRDDGTPNWEILGPNSQDTFILPFLAIPAELFSYAQNSITTYAKAFAQNLLIGGTQLTAKHFTAQIALTTLNDTFRWSKLLDIQQNGNIVFGQGTYRSVNNVQYIFYGTNAMYCTSTSLTAKNETVIGKSFFNSGELRSVSEGEIGAGTHFNLETEEYNRTVALSDRTAQNLCFIARDAQGDYVNKLFTEVPFANARFPRLNTSTKSQAYWPLWGTHTHSSTSNGLCVEGIDGYAEIFVQPRASINCQGTYKRSDLFFKAQPYAWAYNATIS